jgi:hypothetical protein
MIAPAHASRQRRAVNKSVIADGKIARAMPCVG